jgi:hypothetical protein
VGERERGRERERERERETGGSAKTFKDLTKYLGLPQV